MNWTPLIRQFHRWLSIAFVVGVLTYIVAMNLGRPPAWLGLFAFIPLISLLVSGLYLFVLPYVAKVRAGKVRAARARRFRPVG